ncbi:transposase family protein [Clostridium sp. Mt-5]|uniref:Transposase family protein n=1 Tax=Clostridium moutaii TaxID=3240932 RepID=A0ABV4BQY1_9CLOT
MDGFIKILDENLDYVDYKISGGVCYIKVVSNRKVVACPFCGKPSSRVHSTYKRTFQDLPIQGNKVIIILLNRKMFCDNPECGHTTFAERFDFLQSKAKKTNRLENEIINISLNCSSTAASKILRKNIVDVGKSTVCCLLKKKKNP